MIDEELMRSQIKYELQSIYNDIKYRKSLDEILSLKIKLEIINQKIEELELSKNN